MRASDALLWGVSVFNVFLIGLVVASSVTALEAMVVTAFLPEMLYLWIGIPVLQLWIAVRHMRFGIDNAFLRPSLDQLVFTATQKDWYGDVETPEHPDAIAVPHLDITCLSRPISLSDAFGVVATSWIFVEFGYDDARLSEKIHTVRARSHPIFGRLRQVLGSPVEWAVVVG